MDVGQDSDPDCFGNDRGKAVLDLNRAFCENRDMTRRHVLLVLVAGSLVQGAGAWQLWQWPWPGITRQNAERISLGMTLAEVEAVLGGPARDEGTRDWGTDRLFFPHLPDAKFWTSDDILVYVNFEGGVVVDYDWLMPE